MNEEDGKVAEIDSEILKAPAVEQEIYIRVDGRVEIPWIVPKATSLVLEVYRAVSDEPFPVHVISGSVYCG